MSCSIIIVAYSVNITKLVVHPDLAASRVVFSVSFVFRVPIDLDRYSVGRTGYLPVSPYSSISE